MVYIDVHSVLSLLVTCMYTDISKTSDANASSNTAELSEVKMELISILFDRFVSAYPHRVTNKISYFFYYSNQSILLIHS